VIPKLNVWLVLSRGDWSSDRASGLKKSHSSSQYCTVYLPVDIWECNLPWSLWL